MTHKNEKYPVPDNFVDEFKEIPNCTIKYFEDKYGVSTLTVKRWAKLTGIKFEKSNKTLEEQFGFDWIVDQINSCQNANDANALCKRLNIRKTRLESFCKRHNIDISRLKGKTIALAPDKTIVEQMISSGMTNQQIEEHFNVTNPVLKRWYKELGIERPAYDGTVTPMPDKDDLIRLHHHEQKSLHDMAKIFNTSFVKIKQWLNHYQIDQKLFRSKRTLWPTKEQFEKLHITEKMSFKEIADKFGISDVLAGSIAKQYEIDNINYGIGQTSKGELQVLEFVQQFFPDAHKIELNDDLHINVSRPTVSYDICIPDKRLIIEYNGVKFHSEEFNKIPSRHADKMRLANHHGYQILNIFSDEWINKDHIVKSIIKSKIGMNDRIYARKTQILSVDSSTADEFYNCNHIQGKSNNYICSYGLYYGDQLVSCMSFGKHHRNKTDHVVLKRFANRVNLNVVGGASKLFKHAIKENDFNSIISWSDNRWSEGKLYKILGFNIDKHIDIGYSYVYPNEIRKSAQSHTKKLIGCPDNITERDFLFERGIYRIWDCGKIRWIWRRG